VGAASTISLTPAWQIGGGGASRHVPPSTVSGLLIGRSRFAKVGAKSWIGHEGLAPEGLELACYSVLRLLTWVV